MFFRTRDGVYGLFGTTASGGGAAVPRSPPAAPDGPDRVEPEVYTDIATRFYLLPILRRSASRCRPAPPRPVEVASIPLTEDRAPARASLIRPRSCATSVRVAFVVDTAMSITGRSTGCASIRRVTDCIRANSDSQPFRFAVVGYRNSMTRSRGSEYVSVFATRDFATRSASWA